MVKLNKRVKHGWKQKKIKIKEEKKKETTCLT